MSYVVQRINGLVPQVNTHVRIQKSTFSYRPLTSAVGTNQWGDDGSGNECISVSPGHFETLLSSANCQIGFK